MINIITLHHTSSKFIDIQNTHIDKYTPEEYRVFAGIYQCQNNYKTKFYYEDNLINVSRDHHVRMNYMANHVLKGAKDDELLIFMDGDAFPIKKWVPYVYKLLETNKIVAVQRNEIGDTFPHPIFLCTTVGFWRNNKLSWDFSYKGKRFVTSGPALEMFLNENNIAWKPINKTNNINIHPIFFAVYDFIYHHGASFREPITTLDYNRPSMKNNGRRCSFFNKVVKDNIDFSNFIFDKIKKDHTFVHYYFIGD